MRKRQPSGAALRGFFCQAIGFHFCCFHQAHDFVDAKLFEKRKGFWQMVSVGARHDTQRTRTDLGNFKN